MNYQLINLQTWHRREQYEFFRTFDEPFTGVVVEVNVSKLYPLAKEMNRSFFQMYLHRCLQAIKLTPALRLRIVEGEIRKYDEVHASAVIMRSDGSFGFSHIKYAENFGNFSEHVEVEKKRIEVDRSLFPPINLPNEVHFSAMSWIKFKGLSHARKYGTGDTCPKISVGKVYSNHGALLMPLSIHVHHALADGKDMADFIENYQHELDRGDF